MIKVFISQPMNGRTDKQIRAARLDAVNAIMGAHPGESVKILDSYFEDYEENKDRTDTNVPLKYLAKALWVMAGADLAYFAPGWETARGCAIERAAAEEYGVPILDIE